MGLTSTLQRLRVRASSAWRAWRAAPAQEPPAVQAQEERLAAARAQVKRELQLTAEDLEAEAREELLAKVQEDAEAQFEELNECLRGGNGEH